MHQVILYVIIHKIILGKEPSLSRYSLVLSISPLYNYIHYFGVLLVNTLIFRQSIRVLC